ncbi:hypothetical protein V6U78_04275 [Marinospirillum sp. MEB164]|uniref:Host cell division inhibitor Icd-like protein n=1 Tax=Marinospirillum alkalitolerans TaxID=3123374 RepID=A0ABW8PWL9_9GAMM
MNNTPTSPTLSHAPAVRLYRWRLSCAKGHYPLQIIAATSAEARRIFGRFYPSVSAAISRRLPV